MGISVEYNRRLGVHQRQVKRPLPVQNKFRYISTPNPQFNLLPQIPHPLTAVLVANVQCASIPFCPTVMKNIFWPRPMQLNARTVSCFKLNVQMAIKLEDFRCIVELLNNFYRISGPHETGWGIRIVAPYHEQGPDWHPSQSHHESA